MAMIPSNILRIYFVLLLMFTGCSIDKQINYRLKQSARHYEKAIKKGYEPKADTVYVLDSVFITETHIDTTFIEKQGDTILIEKERLKLKYVRIADSVFIEAECLADTIIKRVPYSVQETIYIEKSFFDFLGLDVWWKIALFWLLVVLVGVVILWRLIK